MKAQRHIRLIATLGLAIWLAGCKMGPDYEQVVLPSPEAYRFDIEASDTIINLKWWELFQDPVLDSLIELALVQNQDVRIAAKNVEQAAYALNIRKAELLPKFNVSGQGTWGSLIQFPTNTPGYNVFGGVAMQWELDFWGKLRRGNEAARAQLLASSLGLRSLQIDLIAQVAATYFSLLEARTSLLIAERTLALRESTLDIIQQRFDEGIVAEIDLNQAQIQRAIAASAIPLYKRLIAINENSLSILVGNPPSAIRAAIPLEEQVIPPDIPEGLPSDLLYRRPDILAAEQEIIAQNATIGIAQASRMPTISLTGLLGVASTDLLKLSTPFGWNLGGSLLGPLFHWNQNKRRVDIERSRYEQTVLRYEQSLLLALGEVEDALVSIQTLREEVAARQSHVDAALNAENLSKQRYDKGVTSYLEFLESQRQAFDAQLFLANARSDLFKAYVQLYRALGGGWITRQEAEDMEGN